ncbi:hypothetical protein PGIGA_G00000900, partial [Pangasianodon gigas]|nr:hypothetical protein [Pangasianodon gigas]
YSYAFGSYPLARPPLRHHYATRVKRAPVSNSDNCCFYLRVFEHKLTKSVMLKKAPRAVLKSHMKKKSDTRIGKNADLMVQLNLLLVLHRLAEESRIKAFEEKTATIKVHHVKAVAKKLLKSTRG